MKIEVIPTHEKYEQFLELYPPIQSNKELPDWYKNMNLGNKKSMYNSFHNGIWEGSYTAKKCPAIQDFLSSGLIIPLWSDLVYKEDKNGSDWYFTAPDATGDKLSEHLSYHSDYQTDGMNYGKTFGGLTLKIGLPYRFIVPKGYNVLYQDPFYHFRGKIRCLTGLVEVDKWGYITFPFEILEKDFLLEAGTPLVHAIFYKRDNTKLEINCRKGTEQEYKETKETFFELGNNHPHYKELRTVQKYNNLREL